jgi:hypothetical protein
MNRKSFLEEVKIGATEELSLRLSIATLVRVLFEHPRVGTMMLALERKATLLGSEGEHFVDVKSQPFGGAMRLLDLDALQKRIGEFHFDSEESRAERDFRIFIRPAVWATIREFCLEYFRQPNDAILESDPTRELTEEFYDTLEIHLKPDQYTCEAIGTLIEENPSPTENIHARGYPTVRIYRIFEARILHPAVISAMLENSETCSDKILGKRALEDSLNGGPGRANAVLTLPFREINDFHLGIPRAARNQRVYFQSHRLDETVAAVLEGVMIPKYREHL